MIILRGIYFIVIANIVVFMPIAIADVPVPPIPIEPLYFEPPIRHATDEEKQFNCVELDNAIRYLHPYRYSYKPHFYEDNNNIVATTLVTAESTPIVGGLLGLGYLTYSSIVEEKESRRMLNIEQQISMLQQLKSELHCFE